MDRPSLVAERLSALPEQVGRAFRRRRPLRHVGAVLAAVGLASVFVASAAGGLLLHLDAAPTRRLAREVTNTLLGALFRGRLDVGEIRALGYDGAEVASARVLDAEGRVVLEAEDVRARIDTIELVASLLRGGSGTQEPIIVTIPEALIGRAHAELFPDEERIPSLAGAFLPRESSPPDPFARPVIVQIESIQVDHATARGDVGAPIDAGVRRVHASLFVRSDELVAVDVDDAGFFERGLLGRSISGLADYHLRVRLPRAGEERASVSSEMWASASGSIEQLPYVARVSLRGLELDATLALPSIDGPKLRGLLGPVPFTSKATGELVVQGRIPALSVGGSVEIEQGSGVGTLTLDGAVTVGSTVRVDASVQASELDPRGFVATLPDTRIDGLGSLRAERSAEHTRLRVDVQSNATLANGHVVPAVDAILELAGDHLEGSATIHEAGVSVDTRFALEPSGAVRFSAIAPTARLSEVPRLAGLASGELGARVDGRFDGGVLDARLSGSGAALSVPLGGGSAVGAERASFDGRVRGPVDALTLEARADARAVSVQGERWDRVRVGIAGTVDRFRVNAEVDDAHRGRARASGEVDLETRRARQVAVSLERAGVAVEGSIAELGFGPEGVRARGVSLAGPELGKVDGSLALRGRELVGSLRGEGIDLERAGRLLGLPVDVAGRANVDVSLTPTARGRRGHVELELEEGRVLTLGGISARLSMGFDDDRVETAGFVRIVDRADEQTRERVLAEGIFGATKLCDGATLELRFADGRATLSGPLLDAATWTRAVGRVELDAGDTNLRCLHAKVPFFINPLDEARGLLSARAVLERTDERAAPTLSDVYVRSHGLELVGKDGAWETHRIDAQLRADLDGSSRTTSAELLLFDGTMLLEADLEAAIDLGALGAAPPLATQLSSTPFEVQLHVPRRAISEFDTLPLPLRDFVPTLSGELRVDAELSGTPAEPFAYLSAQAFHVASGAGSPSDALVPPVDLVLGATYEADDHKVGAELEVIHEGLEVAHVSAAAEISVEDLLRLAPDRWTGGVHVELLDLPLGALPALADRDVAGTASGVIAVSGLNRRPELTVDVELPFLQLGETFVDGRLHAKVSPATSTATDPSNPGVDRETSGLADLQIDLEGHDGGAIQVLAHAGIEWEAGLVPTLAKTERGGLVASADRFRLSSFFPFVSGTVSRLDGYLDGKVALEWGRIEDAARGRVALADLDVTDAVVFIPQLGQELRGGTLSVDARTEETRDGPRTVLVVSDVQASGSTGRIHGFGEADLDGLLLTEARGSFQIDEGEELPVTVEGVPMGRAAGRVELAARPTAKGVEVDVEVPSLRLELPQSSTRNVQPLDEVSTIELSAPLGPPERTRAADAFEWALAVSLGDVRIESSGVDLRVGTAADAPLDVTLTDKLRTRGDIVFAGGEVELNKRRFELDRGIVRLREEDAGNPYVNVTAHVDVGDGSRIYVDYAGLLRPITDEKIRFRSDPPRSQAEIVSILLFGEATTAPNAGSVVGSVGGTVATALANELLAQSIFRDVSINLGSTEEGGYVQAAMPLGESLRIDLSVGAQQQQGVRPVGTAGSSAAQTCRDVGLDYKISRRWSLRAWGGLCNSEAEDVRTSVGVDAVWQYSY